MSNSSVYWGAFVLETIDYFLKDKISTSEYQIFFLLCREMDKETNEARLRQIDIKKLLNERYKLKKGKPTISKAIKRLCEKQYVVKLPRIGYMVNPSLFYTGHNRYLRTKIEDFDSYLEKQGIENCRLSLDPISKKLVEL